MPILQLFVEIPDEDIKREFFSIVIESFESNPPNAVTVHTTIDQASDLYDQLKTSMELLKELRNK